MRVVAGVAGGISLKAPVGRDVRPTSDRVKEALFAALGDIRNWRVADFFAGAGALGLEALSRGAGLVMFVEKEQRALRCIRENLERVRHAFGATLAGQTRIVEADVGCAVERLQEFEGAIDLILADPPYHPGPHEFGAAELLGNEPITHWARGALLVLEHASGTPLPWAPQSHWRLIRQRRFGSRTLSFARAPKQVSGAIRPRSEQAETEPRA